ncbi:hypothetical protein [Methylopila sp. 73B]|uniref:hypothetical protein n=1 Tax=Methylopila sp. 73B TaxID=1120792 RepID=UPI000364A3C1|nr:hypothetical protein [Methylopila sp. 73B]
MTAQPLFDTARFRDRLTASGMPEVQARAVTEGFDEALRGATATKTDVENLGATLGGRIDALDAKIDAVEVRLEAKIDSVEERLGARISLLDEAIGRRLAESQANQLKWFVASLFGALGLLFAALKLFP